MDLKAAESLIRQSWKINPKRYAKAESKTSNGQVRRKQIIRGKDKEKKVQTKLGKQSISTNNKRLHKGRSTKHAISEITENLKKSINNNLFTCGIFLDFTVDHRILLSK